MCFLPAWKIFSTPADSWKYYQRELRNKQKQRLYNGTMYQQENDTIPPITTDTTRWKYLCFLDFSSINKQMITYSIHEKTVNFRCKWDTIHNTITITDRTDTTKRNVFEYITLPRSNMQLKGRWLGKNTFMQLTNMPIDSFILIKDKFLFTEEDQ